MSVSATSEYHNPSNSVSGVRWCQRLQLPPLSNLSICEGQHDAIIGFQ